MFFLRNEFKFIFNNVYSIGTVMVRNLEKNNSAGVMKWSKLIENWPQLRSQVEWGKTQFLRARNLTLFSRLLYIYDQSNSL